MKFGDSSKGRDKTLPLLLSPDFVPNIEAGTFLHPLRGFNNAVVILVRTQISVANYL